MSEDAGVFCPTELQSVLERTFQEMDKEVLQHLAGGPASPQALAPHRRQPSSWLSCLSHRLLSAEQALEACQLCGQLECQSELQHGTHGENVQGKMGCRQGSRCARTA